MVGGWNLMALVNLSLSILIFVLGCVAYNRTKKRGPFHIGVAFGFFAISYLIVLLGLERNLPLTLVMVRIFGYFVVILTLYRTGLE